MDYKQNKFIIFIFNINSNYYFIIQLFKLIFDN